VRVLTTCHLVLQMQPHVISFHGVTSRIRFMFLLLLLIIQLLIYRFIQNDCRGFNNCHLVLQMQPHVISFYGVTSRIRFMFLLFLQVSQNWRYESELPLKPSPLTCYRQFGTNLIIMLIFVESQRVHILSTCKVWNKNLECCSIK